MKHWLFIFVIIITPIMSAETYQLYFTRHAEKDSATKDDPELTTKGHQTAQKLQTYLSNKSLQAIYSTEFNRTLATAAPVAEETQLSIELYSVDELQSLAIQLLKLQQNALIVGHSNTTPLIIEMVGGTATSIADDEYGDVFVVEINTSLATVTTEHIKL